MIKGVHRIGLTVYSPLKNTVSCYLVENTVAAIIVLTSVLTAYFDNLPISPQRGSTEIDLKISIGVSNRNTGGPNNTDFDINHYVIDNRLSHQLSL